MKKRLLLLGAPVFQKPVIEKAKAMGLHVGVADINNDAPAASLADVFYQGSIKDYDAMLDVARSFRPDAILSGACDTSVVTVARLCEELGLPGNSVHSSICSTDKVAMLECFKKGGVSSPLYEVVRKAQLKTFEPSIPYPMIVKPTDSAGGRGVNVVNSKNELLPALEASSKAGCSGDVLVEELMKGQEVSVEVLVVGGVPHIIQVTDKLTSGAPHFFEVGHSQPTKLSDADRLAISTLASSAVLSVGLIDSAAHVEIMMTSEGPKMVELGARVGGDWITSYLVDNSVSGIDMVETMIRMSLGEKDFLWEYHNSGEYVAVKFMPSKRGLLKRIEGADEARKLPGVIYVEVTGRIGDQNEEAVDDTARFASVVAKGASREEALKLCERALGLIVAYVE